MNNSSNTRGKTYLAAIGFTTIIGFSFLFVKIALESANPLNLLAHRFSVAFVAIMVPFILGGVKLSLKPKEILELLPLSLLYPVMFFAFQAFGLKYIASSEAGIINATVPIFTMIFAFFIIGEKSSTLQRFSMALSVVGVIYIFLNRGVEVGENSFFGLAFIFISTLSIAGYNVFARQKTQKYGVKAITYVMVTAGFIFFNILSIGDMAKTGNLNDYFLAFNDSSFLWSIIYLGVLSSAATSFLSNYILSRMDAFRVSVFGNLGTLVTVMAGVLFLDEQLYTYHIIGGIVILIGVVGSNLITKKEKGHS